MEKEDSMKKKKILRIDWTEPKTKQATCYIIITEAVVFVTVNYIKFVQRE